MTIKSNERGKGNTFNFDISKKKMEMNLVVINYFFVENNNLY